MTSGKWNIADRVKPIKKKDSVMSLFLNGMGVDSANEFEPPKSTSLVRDISKSNDRDKGAALLESTSNGMSQRGM